MYEICYISIPLYNTSTYAFADDDQKAEMLKLAQAAADSVNAAGGETVSDQVSVLHEAAQNALRTSTLCWTAKLPTTAPASRPSC